MCYSEAIVSTLYDLSSLVDATVCERRKSLIGIQVNRGLHDTTITVLIKDNKATRTRIYSGYDTVPQSECFHSICRTSIVEEGKTVSDRWSDSTSHWPFIVPMLGTLRNFSKKRNLIIIFVYTYKITCWFVNAESKPLKVDIHVLQPVIFILYAL